MEAEGPVILGECPCMMLCGNKIHLSLFLSVFPQMASSHAVIFQILYEKDGVTLHKKNLYDLKNIIWLVLLESIMKKDF